jgi:hypothetical protein
MATSDIVQEIYNLKIHEITILGSGGERYEIWPRPSNFTYVSLSMAESMFEVSVVGTLVIRDIRSTSEQINFNGFEDLIIKVQNPEIPDSFKSLKFKVYNVKTSNDQVRTTRISEDTNIPEIELSVEFTSYEHYLLNYKEFDELAGLTGSDIITKIASEAGKNGLVNSIYEKFFKTGKIDSDTTQKEMFIEPTRNWVWYKQNQLSYPWGKFNSPIKVAQLMQYLAENAVSDANPYACNYMFWQDLDRWNFRSIESLIKEPSDRKYGVLSSPHKVGNIFKFVVQQESNFLRLFESNALSGKYYLVEPKWDQPYRQYLDYNESHNFTEVTYDYFRDYYKWTKVEQHPLIDESISTKPNVVNVIHDRMSGYFSPNYSNREKSVAWEHHGYTYSNRDSSDTWQPMFDQIDLDGDTCRKIQKEIKQKIKDKKIEYAAKKNLKERWKVYRCSICCDTSYVDDIEPVFTQEYKIVAAGGFTDLVNYGGGGFTLAEGQVPQFPNGLTLSYNFESEPFSKTIGEMMYLRDTPDIQTKYLYELELKRIDIAEDILRKSIEKIENLKQVALQIPVCDPNEIIFGCNPGTIGTQNTNQNSNQQCFCSEELKTKYISEQYDASIANRNELLSGTPNYFEKMREIIRTERDRFTDVYEKYRDRKAFFISKEVGFTADNSPLNLFNVKSVTRIPIRGSKYEKLAKKSVLTELYKGLTGSFLFKGFTAGITSYYPYDVYYGGDTSIDPSVKHPYYDAGYNFDVGYNASPAFSLFDASGGSDSSSPLDPTSLIEYFTSFKLNVLVNSERVDWVGYSDYDNDGNFDCQYIRSVPSSFATSNSTNQTLTSNNYEKLYEAAIIESSLKSQVESSVSQLTDWEVDVSYGSNIATINATRDLPCNKTATFSKTITATIEKFYTDNQGNEFLSQHPHICVLKPFGAERLTDFNPEEVVNYLNCRNFLELDTVLTGEEPKRPIENVLEEIESFVRIEFKTPIGTNTLYDFPKGFYDTVGSEYFLPYHVMLTAGPFGTKSSDYNISVLGQDPYGFDVAVKRIKKKKVKLQPDKKALVNDKDYHINETGYVNPLSYYSNYFQFAFVNDERPLSYGYGGIISRTKSSYFNKHSLLFSNDLFNSSYPTLMSTTEDKQDQGKISTDSNNNSFYNSPNPTHAKFNSEIFYHDIIKRATRMNPLALPQSYFEFGNTRAVSVKDDYEFSTNRAENYITSWTTDPQTFQGTQTNEFGTVSSSSIEFEFNINEEILKILSPGNVFAYYQSSTPDPVPVNTDRFNSYVSYYPTETKPITWLSFFEVDVRNINDRYKPEEEQCFYGYYIGSAIWKHPSVSDVLEPTNEEIQKSVWKNDLTGETEYGLIGPELDADDSTFDRNFAAQFIVMARQEFTDPCVGYPCANPAPPDNSTCPDEDPLCNCPCQELRPDKMTLPENRQLIGMGLTGGYYGLTGAEPTNAELKRLENEIKECDLIEQVLGEDWLGCVWSDPKHPLNCNCPCIGEKFQEYLKYSQTYCTFWQTPPERPLLRNAQMVQIQANKATMLVNGDFSLRPGTKIYIDFPGKRYGGYWLVSGIAHTLSRLNHIMMVSLIRDSEFISHSERSDKLELNT